MRPDSQHRSNQHQQHTTDVDLLSANALHVSVFGGRIFEFADNDSQAMIAPQVAQVCRQRKYWQIVKTLVFGVM
jgi:hypothetical protein